jgi:hypothetical protein
MPISHNGVSRYFLHMFKTRRNPLYVWAMLDFLEVFADTTSDPLATIEVPIWVFRQLQPAAKAFCAMGRGHARDSDAEHNVVAAAGKVSITPKQALAEVAHVLGLARQGWNAFDAYHRDELREDAWLQTELFGEERAEVQRSLGLAHRRSRRRAFRRARGA